MDTTETGSHALPQVQISLLGPGESAKSGETKKEIKRQQWRVASKKWRANHPKYYDKLIKDWRQKNPEKVKEITRRRYHKNRAKILAAAKIYYQKNKSEYRKWQKERRSKLRQNILVAYGGPLCKCCGETMEEFLSIDHIAGNGNKHRRSIRPSGRNQASANFYEWLKKEKFPPGFQVLCIQCNFAKGKYGSCPHEKIKTPIDLFWDR